MLIPDSGRGYMSQVFDDEWMAGYGFLRSEGRTVADVSRSARRRRSTARVRAPERHGAPSREPDARSWCVAAAGGEGRAAAGGRGGARRGRRTGVDGLGHPRRLRARCPGREGHGTALADDRHRPAARARRRDARHGARARRARRRPPARRADAHRPVERTRRARVTRPSDRQGAGRDRRSRDGRAGSRRARSTPARSRSRAPARS